MPVFNRRMYHLFMTGYISNKNGHERVKPCKQKNSTEPGASRLSWFAAESEGEYDPNIPSSIAKGEEKALYGIASAVNTI